MPLSRDSRAERILKAVRRAEFRLRQNIERINWEEDVLLPEIEAIKSGKAVPSLGLVEGAAFTIQVVDDHPNRPSDQGDGFAYPEDYTPASSIGQQPTVTEVGDDFRPRMATTVFAADADGNAHAWRYRWDSSG